MDCTMSKPCFEVKIKFRGECEIHETHLGADNEHDAFTQAISNHLKYVDMKIVESYNCQRIDGSYQDFLDKMDSRRYD